MSCNRYARMTPRTLSWKAATALTLGVAALSAPATALAAPISGVSAQGASASGHDAALAIDGRADTYWESPSASSMQDYRRHLDFDLGGTYDVTSISVLNVPGAYYHYEIYLSADGETFDKVAYKANDEAADGSSNTFTFDAVRACYARISVSYNSASQAVNLAEVTFDGDLVSREQVKPAGIEVEAFSESSWGREWERVETDAAYAEQKTLDSVGDLVDRVLGEGWRDRFDFELRAKKDGKDVFEVSDAGAGRIRVAGNDGVSIASGLNYYLRTYCKVDYNPLFGSQLDMPETLPAVGKKVLKYTNYEYRYALNFCTYSYTMAFWDWDDYEPFLDWCAMNGVNLMLDIVGQEEVLRETLTGYGYTDDEVKEYISGPAYYAWFYMQNLYSVGGPLPDSWFEQRVELGRKIHDRMQAFGINPVIQGFGGQVPVDFQEKNPSSVAASSGSWSGYDRPYMIKTYLTDADRAAGKEDYFQKVGTSFYEAQERVFGDVSHYYAVDPFHEGGTIPDGFDIVDIYRTVQEKMLEHDEDATWVMQQWQWGINENKLSGLAKKEQALVLDLQSDLRSQSGPMESQQVPWVWNMLHNFGGRMGMDGVPEVLATQIPKDYDSSSYMRGIGITPEAIENSPMVYEMLFDMTWEQDPVNYRRWVADYVERRYGGTDEKIQEAWEILLDTVYKHVDGEYYQGASESLINARPSDGSIGAASTWGHSDIDYDKEEFERAAELFIECYDTYKGSEAFRYDFVDVMRQVLANSFQEYQPLAGAAYKAGDLEAYKTLSSQMLAIIKAQDALLSSSDDFLLGTWISDARTMLEGEDDWTADLFELNARSLITTWGQEKNSSLIDYSNRQWAGLTGDYYYKRWETHIKNRLAKLEDGTDFSDPNWFMYGWEWANRKSDEGFEFETEAADVDAVALAREVMAKYSVTAMGEYTDAAASERVNLASGRTVVDVDSGEEVAGLTDGNTDTGWTAPGKAEALLEVDLGGTYAITGLGLTLQQIAADFPLAYEMQVWDGSAWNTVAKSEGDTLSSKNEVEVSAVGSKVRYRLRSTDGRDLTGIYELNVWGAAEPEESYTNVALGGTASAGSTEGSRSLSAGIDGDEGSLWVGNGSDPNWYRVDLPAAERVDRARLVFETAGRLFKFRVVVVDADGQERTVLDLRDNEGELDRVYEMDLGYEVSAAYVEFTGSVGGTAWPAIAELELLQAATDEVEGENIASTATITSSATKDAPEDASALVDGTGTAWVSRDGATPAWWQMDFPSARYVENVVLSFEEGQADRSMQFTLVATDAEGEEHVVYERGADDLSREQGIKIDVPVGLEVSRLRMDITAAKIPSWGGDAWPLVAEVEVMATPKNVAADSKVSAAGGGLSTEELARLVDGDDATGTALGDAREIAFELDRPVDVNTLRVAGAVAGGEALRFRAEYRTVPEDGEGEGTWKTLADYSANATAKGVYLARLADAVYTDAVRLTVLNDAEVSLAEVGIYQADVSASLLGYLAEVDAEMARATVGEAAGNYRRDAYDALAAVVEDARAAATEGVGSREVASWRARVAAALRTFRHEGFVTIDRNGLYVAVDRAQLMLDSIPASGAAQAEKLQVALDAAEKVADARGEDATQAKVDAAADALEEAIDAAIEGLDAEERYATVYAAATAAKAAAREGDFEGCYPASAIDALGDAIAAAARGYIAADGDAAAIDAASDALGAALDEFTASVVRIDASGLEAALVAAGARDEAGYDRKVWAAFARALADAKAVDVAAISQADLDAAVAALIKADAALDDAVLDRARLAREILRAEALHEGDYTEETWKVLASALKKAVTARDEVSTSQDELDAAYDELVEARLALKLKDHGLKPGPDEGGDSGDGGSGEGGQDVKPGQGGSDQGGASQGSGQGGSSVLPTTGDAGLVASLGAGLSGLGALLAGVRRRLRRRDR